MNAIDFLVKEHNKVRSVFKDLSKPSLREATKKNRFNKLCHDLVVHEKMEQKTWYPHFKNNKTLSKIVKHLLTEEKTAATIIKEFKKIKIQEQWEKKFNKFKKAVEKHADEEEHKLFPKVEKILSKVELQEIGKEMRKFKQKFKKK